MSVATCEPMAGGRKTGVRPGRLCCNPGHDYHLGVVFRRYPCLPWSLGAGRAGGSALRCRRCNRGGLSRGDAPSHADQARSHPPRHCRRHLHQRLCRSAQHRRADGTGGAGELYHQHHAGLHRPDRDSRARGAVWFVGLDRDGDVLWRRGLDCRGHARQSPLRSQCGPYPRCGDLCCRCQHPAKAIARSLPRAGGDRLGDDARLPSPAAGRAGRPSRHSSRLRPWWIGALPIWCCSLRRSAT